MDRRFLRRRRAGRSAQRKVLLWTSLVATLVAALVIVVGFAPVFVVEDVEVAGGPAPVIELARSNAAAPMGKPLARINTSEIAQRVKADKRVESVTVGRGWPSTVTIALTMRIPAAVLKQPNQPLRLVDATGVAYEEVARKPPGLPQISAPRGKVDGRSLAGALEAVASLGEPLRGTVSSINVTADGDVRFTMGSIDVLWGRPDQVQGKAAATLALLAQGTIDPDGGESLTIDVTAPQTPIVTGLPLAPSE